ncbi:hypothetical protein [Andreprevotia sp. IGB-42]|uniref:hypothetical protein n=1 Tax=Andreprevotia sp. IGB-42 TaxID=2497473 RepID=UPI00135802AE|nr:hypothetical protein [Andreprevotia sp. IGB-42]
MLDILSQDAKDNLPQGLSGWFFVRIHNLELKMEDNNPQGSEDDLPWRVFLRIAISLYLISLPACTRDGQHFGPGFMVAMVALILVPLFAVLSTVDMIFAWREVHRDSYNTSARTGAIFSSMITLVYCGVIAFVLFQ